MSKKGTYGIDINQFSGEITVGGTISVSREGELKRTSEYNVYEDFSSGDYPSFSIGIDALGSMTLNGGSNNVAFGHNAGKLMTSYNFVGIGFNAGAKYTTGNSNVCVGPYAGSAAGGDSTGALNTFVGSTIAAFSTGGSENVGLGGGSLYFLQTGSYNMAIGRAALQDVTTGNYNVGVGRQAGKGITTGSNNTVLGSNLQLGAAVSNTLVVGAGNRKDVFADANGIVLGDGALGTEVFNLVISNYALLDFPDDSTAATGGIPVGGVYHTSGTIKIRLS